MDEDRSVFDALKALIECTDPRADAEEAARKLISRQGSKARAFELAAEDIASQTGIGKAAAQAIDMIDELSRYAAVEAKGENPRLDSLGAAGEYFIELCRGRHIEYCFLACLDEKKRLIGCKPMGKGTLDEADVYVRDIAGAALRSGAKYAFLAHNHPGGSLTPSRADIELTERASKALKLIGVKLIDHIIVTRNAFVGLIGGDGT